MTKKEAIEQLRAAKTAHIQWRARAQALVAGVPLDKEQVPVAYTDCRFGKWYYGSGQALNDLASFQAIDGVHENLHLTYMQIFQHLFAEQQREGLVSRLFGAARRHKKEQLAAAQALLPRLVEISKELLELIETLENDLRRLSEEEFAARVEE